MIEALIAGKLYGRAEQRTGKSGRPFTVAKVRAAVAEGEVLFVNVVAFSESASAALLALEDGDAVSLAGTLTPKVWTDREGNARPALDLVANAVLTAYQAKKKREAVAGAQGEQRQQHRRGPQEPAGEDFGGGAGDDWLQGGRA